MSTCKTCRNWDAHNTDLLKGDCRAPGDHRYWHLRMSDGSVAYMDSFERASTKSHESCHAWCGGDDAPRAMACTCYAEDYDNTGIHCLWCRLLVLDVLASNLAVAGGLCEAFAQGHEQREHERLYSDHGYRTEQDWRPGCAMHDNECVEHATAALTDKERTSTHSTPSKERRMASDKADGLTHDEWERAEEIVRKSRGDTSYEMLGQVDYARALLLAHATIEKQARVVKAARLLSDAMYVGEEGWGLWCSTRNGPADHAALMIALRSAIDAMGDAEGGG